MYHLKAISQDDITPPENEYSEEEIDQMESEYYEQKFQILRDERE